MTSFLLFPALITYVLLENKKRKVFDLKKNICTYCGDVICQWFTRYVIMDNPMINLANTLGNYSDKPDKNINS